MQRRIGYQAGAGAAKTIALAGKQGVVPGREAFQLHPGHPGGGQRALFASGLQLLGGGFHIGPGLGRLVGVQASLLEGVLVVIEHRCRAVERERHHLPIGRRVVTGHGRDVGAGVEMCAVLLHQRLHRLHGAFGGHQRGGGHFLALQDVRGLARTEGGDGGGEGFRVLALVHRHHLVVGLLAVEVFGQVIDPGLQGTVHRMPPLDFGDGKCRRRGAQAQAGGQGQVAELHGNTPQDKKRRNLATVCDRVVYVISLSFLSQGTPHFNRGNPAQAAKARQFFRVWRTFA